jgi:predicted aspartyl protease
LSKKLPFHESKYRQKSKNGRFDPFLEIIIGSNKKPIIALADTGCTGGLALLKSQIEGLDLGRKITDDSFKVTVADGHQLGGDIYLSTIELDGEKRDVTIMVIDPDNIKGYVDEKDASILLGREFLDFFDVVFKGKKRTIAFYNP